LLKKFMARVIPAVINLSKAKIMTVKKAVYSSTPTKSRPASFFVGQVTFFNNADTLLINFMLLL
jgi:hypothetical protein